MRINVLCSVIFLNIFFILGFTVDIFSDVSLEELVKQKKKTVLIINCIDEKGDIAQGSGFCISPDGYVLATAHQVKGAKRVEAKTIDGKTLLLTIEYISYEKDISVLKSNETFRDWVNVFEVYSAEAGASIFTLASPDNLAFSVITGTVSNPNRIYRGNKVYQLTLYADPGASGAPVFDKNGNFIGMIVGKLEGTAFSLALSSSEIVKFLETLNFSIKQNEKVNTSGTQLIETEIIPLPDIDRTILIAIEAYNKGVNSDDINKKYDYYKKSAQLFPEFFEAWFNLGVVSEILGDVSTAEKAYRQAVKINSDSLEAMRNLGRLLLKANKLSEAKTIFQKAINIYPAYPQLYNDLGETLRRMNQIDEAEKYFNKAITLDKEYALAYYNLGLIYLEKEDEENAIKYFQDYLKYTQDNSDKEKISQWIEEMKKEKKIQ